MDITKIDPIVKLYLKKIASQEMVVKDVPERWRDAVRKILENERVIN